ncbi:MAG: ComF family protein [Marmoricola sp.]
MRDAVSDLALGSTCAVCGRPGRVLCRDCASVLPHRARRTAPDPCPEGLAPCFAAGWYEDPLRPLVLAHKERRAFGIAGPLGRVLAGVLTGALDEVAGPEVAGLVLVPVPSSTRAVRVRGHDSVRRTCEHAARQLRAAYPGHRVVVRSLLAQRTGVADQAGLDAAERAANLAGRLVVVPRVHRRLARSRLPARFVLCDDIITTGATVREAQRALEDAGMPVTAVVALAATRRRGGDSRRSLPLLRLDG